MTVLVVLPTYNERANIETIAERLLQHPFTRILIVDDASPDGTGEVADRLAATTGGRVDVLHRKGPRGLGRAYIDGLRLALTTDATAICQMDADLSHDPKYLPDLVGAIDSYDLVIGSRYLRGVSVVNWSLQRIALSAFANRYIRAVTGLRPSDVTSGYRLWRREALSRIPLDHAQASGYAFLTEMLFNAAKHDCRVGEVPIVFFGREEGDSKVSLKVLLESLWTPWRLWFRNGRVRATPTR
jgi:dolichol-phosphate mannosyltransferase